MLLDTEYIYHAQFPQTTPNHSNASERKINHPVLTVIQSWGICGFGSFSLDLFWPRIRFQLSMRHSSNMILANYPP